MGRAFQVITFAMLWMAVLGIALPMLDAALYASRLASMPVPVKVGMPVAGIKPDAIRDTWHASRGGGRRHEGIDIFSRRGTPVQASTEGILIRRGQNRLGGNVVWVLGPGGQRHYYAHLDGFALLFPGERIRQGTVLGYVGNTGNAINTPPHLHYGIYMRTGAINPFPLLASIPD
jgi:murein DD-endopeptidase MepM/ murein hydrolase activator NlpD